MSNIEVFTHGNEIIIWFELVNFVQVPYPLKYAKVWQDWNYGTFEGFLFFLCQNAKLIISFQL